MSPSAPGGSYSGPVDGSLSFLSALTKQQKRCHLSAAQSKKPRKMHLCVWERLCRCGSWYVEV